MRQRDLDVDSVKRVEVRVRGRRGARWISGGDRQVVQLGRRRKVRVFLTSTQRDSVGRYHAHHMSLRRS